MTVDELQDIVILISNKYRKEEECYGRNVITTLYNPTIIDNSRMSGTTTRQIDYAIQLLFKRNIVICLDHCRGGEDSRINELLAISIMKRLEIEHGHIISRDKVRYNRKDNVIYLIK